MKVREIMTSDIQSCHPETNVAEVAKVMWDHDCGVLPVVSSDGRVTGMITDRDICIGVATTGRTADRVSVREVGSDTVTSCLPTDEVADALKTMKAHKVRRLPVIDEQGHLKGLLSLNDVVLRAGRKRNGLSSDDIVETLKGISEHRHVQVTHGAA